jgi:hypothetical protein
MAAWNARRYSETRGRAQAERRGLEDEKSSIFNSGHVKRGKPVAV